MSHAVSATATKPGPEHGGASARLRGLVRNGDVAGSLAVVVIASIAVVALLRIWHANLHVPFGYGGDSMLTIAFVRDVIDHGWFLVNPDLGYPAGQHIADYGAPSGDNLTFAFIKLLTLFTSSAGLIVNLVFLLSFPIVALVAFLVLRRLGIGVAIAIVVATLYTLLPYHFQRGEGHLFLSCYYAVPLGACLVLDVMARRSLFARRRREGPRLLAWASGRSVGTLAICAVIASGGIYYAVFTLLLLTAIALISLVMRLGREPVLTAAILCAAIVAVTVINMAPGVLYHLEHGPNPYTAHRQPLESELYGMKFMDLVVPVVGHHIDALNQFQGRYHQTTPLLSEPTQSLGIVATVGFLWLLVVALGALVARTRARAPADGDTADRERHAAFAVVVCFLIATVGGISTFIAYTVTPQIRGWGRMSVYIAFIAFFAVGLLLERLRARTERRPRGRLVMAAVLTAILLGGVFDQTNYTFVPAYGAAKAEYTSDATLARAIDRVMPRGSAIMQMPYVPFPENPGVGAMYDYDQLRPYVQGGGMRWSYGAVKGRIDDWQASFFGVTPEQIAAGEVRGAPLDGGRPTRASLTAIVAAGFDGLYLDRFGYGGGIGPFERDTRRIVGRAPLVSPNGRQVFFDLRPFEASLRRTIPAARLRALGNATTRPLVISFEKGFYAIESAPGQGTWHWAQQAARLEIDNPARSTRQVRLVTAVQTGATPANLTFTLPDGSVVRRRSAGESRPLSIALSLRPGDNTVRVTTDAPKVPGAGGDVRQLYMRLINTRVVEPAATLPRRPAPAPTP